VRDKSASGEGHRGVEDPTHAWKLHVREPRDPVPSADLQRRIGGRKSDEAIRPTANGGRKSYSGTVPRKRSNETREGQRRSWRKGALTKENAEELNRAGRRVGRAGQAGSDRVRKAAKRDEQMQFTALLHPCQCRSAPQQLLQPEQACGGRGDGVTGKNMGRTEDRLVASRTDHRRGLSSETVAKSLDTESYGQQRPWESQRWKDKIVQSAVVQVLNQIWEEDFLDFRTVPPGRLHPEKTAPD